MAEKTISTVDERLEGVILKNPVSGAVNKATKSKTGKTIGAYLFIAGFLVAVIVGILAGLAATNVGLKQGSLNDPSILGIMALIGLVIGLVNISDKEAINFLIGAIAINVAAVGMSNLMFVGGGTMGIQQLVSFVGTFIGTMMQAIAMFVGPAAVVVGLKVVYSAARKA